MSVPRIYLTMQRAAARPPLERMIGAMGFYAIEYQEGSTDEHFASHTTDITAVKKLMKEFLVGKDTWKRRHGWRRLSF